MERATNRLRDRGKRLLGRSLLIVLAFLSFGAMELFAQGWTNEGVGPIGARWEHTLVWDEDNNRLLLFSGEDIATQQTYNDLWSFDPTSGNWTQIVPAGGVVPATRVFSRAVWNSNDGAMVIFGGFDFAGGGNFIWRSDLWSYQSATNQWIQLSSGGGPSARGDVGMVYDPISSNVFVIGGFNGAVLSDVWAWDGQLNTWIVKASIPSSRYFHSAVLDPVSRKIYVFGGFDSTHTRSTTLFSYDIGADQWTTLETAPITARSEHSAVWDSVNGGMLIFGGDIGGTSVGDLVFYDPIARTWTPQVQGPAARNGASAAWNTTTGEFYLYDGLGVGGDSADRILWNYQVVTGGNPTGPAEPGAKIDTVGPAGPGVDPRIDTDRSTSGSCSASSSRGSVEEAPWMVILVFILLGGSLIRRIWI